MIRIGVTGGIGSGKSLVCDIFRKLGVPVYNADERARWLMNEASEIKKILVARFGPSIYKNDQLDRRVLAEMIFNDKKAIEFVNGIVHPAVGHDFEVWCSRYHSSPLVAEEAALLFESGSYKKLDKLVTVFAPEEIRIKRVMKRDHTTFDHVKSRMNNQWSDEEKIKLSDFIIYNDEKSSVLEQVLNLYQQLINDN
jgi:dephospho-CoA kinase